MDVFDVGVERGVEVGVCEESGQAIRVRHDWFSSLECVLEDDDWYEN